MTSSALPDRPNLEQLKKQAKSLLHAAREGDAEALARMAALPAFSTLSSDALARESFALHDAQSALAREHGFPSWNALRDEVESRSLSFEAAIDEFVKAAVNNAPDRARRLLARHPSIPQASFHAALALGDLAEVEARLLEQPTLATLEGGPENWVPLLYLCHTCVGGLTIDSAQSLVAIARRLFTLGADPNAEYHWNWHPELPRTALWGALCAVRYQPLAEALLEAGANPTDGVSAHIAAGGCDITSLELLDRFKLNPNGIPGGVPPLAYLLQWARKPEGAIWLLDHGADPNLPLANDESPVHTAARRFDSRLMAALASSGADLTRRRADGRTPYELAVISGNEDVAEWLEAHGAAVALQPIDRFVAACSNGDRNAAAAMLAVTPELTSQLVHEHHLLLEQAAEVGDVNTLGVMMDFGFDANVKDTDNVTPLHRAAMGGYPAAVAVLLAHGADLGALDGMFAATPLVWAVEGTRHPAPNADHVATARVLIDAGSSIEWTPPEGAPSPEGTLDALRELVRAATSR